MTSKEALENVVFATPEEYDAIKKNLEVLEILKDFFALSETTMRSKYIRYIGDLIIDDVSEGETNYKALEEWLKNDL